MLLNRFVTGANALIRKDFASSVFPERSPLDLGLDLELGLGLDLGLDLGLEGGLGGFSMLREFSSAEDAGTLVLDDPALIFSTFFSQITHLESFRPLHRLAATFCCRSSASSSLLEELEELESLLSVDSDFSDLGRRFLSPDKEETNFVSFLDVSRLGESLESFLRSEDDEEDEDDDDVFDPLEGIRVFDPIDFRDTDEDEGAINCRIPSKFASESCELTDILLCFFILSYFEREGSPFSMFKLDFLKSLLMYLPAMTLLEPTRSLLSFFGTGGFPRASGELPRREFTDDVPGHPPAVDNLATDCDCDRELEDDDGCCGVFIFDP